MTSLTNLTPLPYPDPTDQPFVHLDIQALAEETAEALPVVSDTAPPHRPGRRWTRLNGRSAISDGLRWVRQPVVYDYATKQPTVADPAEVWVNQSGANGVSTDAAGDIVLNVSGLLTVVQEVDVLYVGSAPLLLAWAIVDSNPASLRIRLFNPVDGALRAGVAFPGRVTVKGLR